MRDQRLATVQPEQKVFGSPAHIDDSPSGKPPLERGGEREADVGPPQQDLVDAGAQHHGREAATHYVYITTAVERKIEALLSHKSQLPDPEATGQMVRSWTRAIAESAGLPEGSFAEAVQVIGTA